MKKILFGLTIMTIIGALPIYAQDYDDIYYNPKKDKTIVTKKSKKSNYIKDFENMDVDEYNRRGQYYSTPVDTIGVKAETDEDFVYTQQIQKYYNPTIVIDNADILADVLNNSYGNVDIVFENGNPFFAPSYASPYFYNYYGWGDPWYNNWYWGSSWGPSWGWGSSWIWGPSWSWNWGPSWGWGPSWSWNWGPSWGWGPAWSWGPSWGHHHHHYADYRPGGRVPNRPGNNWASNTRPGGNNQHGMNSNSSRYPSNTIFGGNSVNHHRTYSNQTNSGSAANKNSYNGTQPNQGRVVVDSDGHRRYNSTGSYNNTSNNSNTSNSTNSNYHRSNSNNNSYNNSYNNNSSRSNYNSSGFGGRSSGGSFGGGRSTGGSGGARGRHR